ncbi:MAG: DUF58 domain-containing protein [Lachnospiraceae bacterium]|nr:DUF58 domain-containing protein [Lachnospiraceae bacterium]
MIALLTVGIVAWLLFMAEMKVYLKLWNRNLSVKISFKNREIFEGEQGELLEVVENKKHLPLSMLKVKFHTDRNLAFDDVEGSNVSDLFYRNDVFQIGGGERITRTLTFTGRKRGYYKIMGIDLVSTDLLMGMDMAESRREDSWLYVYPKPFSDEEFMQSLQQLNGEVLTRQHLIEDPFEYRGIREYQPYDTMRSVNWKATARTGTLKVNQRNYTALQTIRIFFNIDDLGILKKDDAVEMCLRICAALSAYFIAQGTRVSLDGNGVDVINGEPVGIEAGAGNGQMDQIYRALARVDTAKDRVDFAKTFREKLLNESNGTITIFVSVNAYDDLLNLIREYQDLGKEYVWFYPVLKHEKPLLPEWAMPHVRWVNARDGKV